MNCIASSKIYLQISIIKIACNYADLVLAVYEGDPFQHNLQITEECSAMCVVRLILSYTCQL
jgi:hypothetical protein